MPQRGRERTTTSRKHQSGQRKRTKSFCSWSTSMVSKSSDWLRRSLTRRFSRRIKDTISSSARINTTIIANGLPRRTLSSPVSFKETVPQNGRTWPSTFQAAYQSNAVSAGCTGSTQALSRINGRSKRISNLSSSTNKSVQNGLKCFSTSQAEMTTKLRIATTSASRDASWKENSPSTWLLIPHTHPPTRSRKTMI